MHIVGRKEPKYNDVPTCTRYTTVNGVNYLKPRKQNAQIREPLNLYKREPSERPEPNTSYMKPFGEADPGQPRIHPGFKFPQPKMTFYPGAMWNKKGKKAQTVMSGKGHAKFTY